MDNLLNFVYNIFMLDIATICMLIAVIIFYGCSFFINKNKPLSFLMQAFCLISLLCLGIVVANSQNNFSAYAIFLIVAIIPQFLGLFDLQTYLNAKYERLQEIKKEAEKIENEHAESQKQMKNEEDSDDIAEEPPATPKEKKYHLLSSKGELLNGVACVVSAICVSFSGLYIGLETFYGLLFGPAFGFALMFLYLALKKEINLVDLLGSTLMFIGAGLLIGSVVIVVLYSMELTNLLYCAGALLLAIHILISAFKKSKFNNIIYVLATLCLFATILF